MNRNLATKAIRETAAHISGPQEATADVSAAIDAVSGTIRTISPLSDAVAAAVHERQATTAEIARTSSRLTWQSDRLRDKVDRLIAEPRGVGNPGPPGIPLILPENRSHCSGEVPAPLRRIIGARACNRPPSADCRRRRAV